MRRSVKGHFHNKNLLWNIHAGGVGAVVVLTLLAYMVGLRPLFVSYGEVLVQKSTLISQQSRISHLKKSRKSVSSLLAGVCQELEASQLTLQTSDFRNEHLAQLTDLAELNGLNVDGLQTTDVIHNDHYDMVPIQMTGFGRFPDCAAFLHQLNSKYPDTGVKSFELKGKPGPKPVDSFFRFSMVWYASPLSSTEER